MELDEVEHKCKTQVKEESGDYYLVIAKIGMSGLGKESGRKAWLENWNRWLRQHGKACGKDPGCGERLQGSGPVDMLPGWELKDRIYTGGR